MYLIYAKGNDLQGYQTQEHIMISAL